VSEGTGAGVYVLDASALLAAMLGEPGAERVREVLSEARVGTVNLSEVVAKLQDHGVPDPVIDESLEDLGLVVVPFDAAQAVRAGKLRGITRAAGLSLGDRACLALAGEIGGIALTTDRAWNAIRVGVAIEQAR